MARKSTTKTPEINGLRLVQPGLKHLRPRRHRTDTIAQRAIEQIAQLYAVEKEARGISPEERVVLRQAKAL